MDAALSIAASAPAGLPNAGAAPVEEDGEGGFTAALTRSLAGAVESAPLAIVAASAPAVPATPIPTSATAALPTGTGLAPGTAAVALAPMPELAPTPAPIPAEAPPLPATPKASTVVTQEATDDLEMEDEHVVEQPATDPALLTSPQPPTIPVPVLPGRPQPPGKPSVSAPADEDVDEAVSTVPWPASAPVSTPAVPTAQVPVATSSHTAGAASPQSDGIAPLIRPPAPEAEVASGAPLPDTSAPGHHAPVEPHRAATERGASSATTPAHADLPTLPLELAGLRAQPRLASVETMAPAAAPPPPSPARQVSSVAVALAFAPGGSDGFSLSLDPAELGRVEIRVQREGDSHSIRVTAERPETLALLQRDRHELDRGLAEAGLRVDSAGIDFSLDTRAGSGFGQGPDTGRHGERRGQAGGTARLPVPEREAPPPRLLRSLLDLHI